MEECKAILLHLQGGHVSSSPQLTPEQLKAIEEFGTLDYGILYEWHRCASKSNDAFPLPTYTSSCIWALSIACAEPGLLDAMYIDGAQQTSS